MALISFVLFLHHFIKQNKSIKSWETYLEYFQSNRLPVFQHDRNLITFFNIPQPNRFVLMKK